MSFILEQDYSVLITDEQLTQVTERQSDKDICLNQSIEEVKEYIRHWFDADYDMREFSYENNPDNVTASENDRIYDTTNSKLYICIQDAENRALSNTAYFEEKDDRNQKLVQVTIDVFLYHLHTRLNPRNVPQHRKIRYDGDGDINNAMSAIKWLLMVQKGTITPNLTIKTDEDGNKEETGQSIIWGNSKTPDYRSTNNGYTG